MNVFGYGSLMWDDWQNKYACRSKRLAVLEDYRRTFNKASVVNWGTKQAPGPTLNVVPDPGSSCVGFIFEFPDTIEHEVMLALKEREGGFDFPLRSVRLETGDKVNAYVPVYAGTNTIKNPAEIVAMVTTASGKSGKCRDYVLNIAKELKQLGVSDAAVERLAHQISTIER
jgi:cation transport regulator ChaC